MGKRNFNPELKGIVSQDFEGLQMILMNKSWVPDVPMVVCYSYKFSFSFSTWVHGVPLKV